MPQLFPLPLEIPFYFQSNPNVFAFKVMVWKLLRRNISISQIVGYIIAAFVGLSIILIASKFYCDFGKALIGENQDLNTNDYLVVSTPVSMFDSFGFGSGASGIQQNVIDELLKQEWVKDVGAFTPANFNVSGAVNLAGKGIGSYVFLESVPDKFLDVVPKNWKFSSVDPYNQEIPIIVSREYLALYNFGFAKSRGLPQLSEALVASIPIDLYFNGNGKSDIFKARIVGFSDRLNTVAVPSEFMDWANDNYSSVKPQPSRLILELSDPGNPGIGKFLNTHGLVAADEDLEHGKIRYLFNVVTAVVIAIGLVICVLSLFILVLSVSLLLQKNKEKNAALLLLGYTPWKVSRSYFALIASVNASVLIVSYAVTAIVSRVWATSLVNLELQPSSLLIPFVWGAFIMVAITGINYWTIYRAVKKVF